jgi:hypothetical protein
MLTLRGHALALSGVVCLAMPCAGQLAVVTNPASPLQNLSLEELSFLYLGQTVSMEAGEILLAEYGPLREGFYRSVLQMRGAQVDRHWIGVVFRGGKVNPPIRFDTAADLRDFVLSDLGAIAFLPLGDLDSMKVLTINGFLPTDPGYPIR